jgi:hypothetical protein
MLKMEFIHINQYCIYLNLKTRCYVIKRSQKLIKSYDRLASFSPFFLSFFFFYKFWIVYSQNSTTVTFKKRPLYSEWLFWTIVVNFVYLKIIFLEHENQRWETWIMRVITKHFIHNKNVKNFHFSNKATENYHSLNNRAASVRPHFIPHSIQ